MASLLRSFLGSHQSNRQAAQFAGDTPQDRNEVTISQLKKVYFYYQQNSKKAVNPANPLASLPEREKEFGRVIPLFCNAFRQSKGGAILQKFPDVHEFAEDVSSMFVTLVSERAKALQGSQEDIGLLQYLCEEKGGKLKIGFKLLQALNILSDTQESIVQRLLHFPLFGTLVNCTRIFIDPPPPHVTKATTPTQHPSQDMMSVSEDQKEAICKLFHSILTCCCKYPCALQDVLEGDALSYLFSCSSTAPCAPDRVRWRKLSSDVLINLSRYNMVPEFIDLVQRRGILRLCLHNLNLLAKSSSNPPRKSEKYVSPLEVVDLFVPLFCCLKDSCDYNPNLLGEFNKCFGYNFLYEFLMEMDKRDGLEDKEKRKEAHDATHQMMNVICPLCFQGYFDLPLTITERGPYQDENFHVPIPAGGGLSVRNKDSFKVLERVFLNCKSVFMGLEVLDTMNRVFMSDYANYFIIDSLHTLPHLIEELPRKHPTVQEKVFGILEFVVCTLNYVPSAELANISLLLQDNTQHLELAVLVLNNLIKLATNNVNCKEVFREVGVVLVLMNCLKERVAILAESEPGEALSVSVVEAVHHYQAPQTMSELQDQFLYLLVECLRILLDGNNQNVQFFRSSDGFKIVTDMMPYGTTRRLACGLLSLLLVSEDGVGDMSEILDYMNYKPNNAIGLKYDLLKTIYRTFEMESKVKVVFREANGFQYLVSYMSKLDGSLSAVRTLEWTLVDRLEILEYVKLILSTIATALRGNPANAKHFQENIRFESFSEPLRYLGCFAHPVVSLQEASSTYISAEQQSKSFLSFNAEFVTHMPPSLHLHPNSCIYAAAHVFQYLRDMAVEVDNSEVTLNPILPEKLDTSGVVQQYIAQSSESIPVLTHPGPLLCMVDLLPGVHPSVVELNVAEWFSSKAKSGQPPTTTHSTKKRYYENFSPVKGGSSLSVVEVSPKPKRLPKVTSDTVDMPKDSLCDWCLYLQERIASEIYHLVTLTQNQQVLCQAGLPERLIQRCSAALADENHPLHQPLQRTFEKLSYQSMSAADLRNFLRLGGPLFCKYNEVVDTDKYIKISPQLPFDMCDLSLTPEEDVILSFEGYDPQKPDYDITVDTESQKSFGGSLSLTRIQSLVSMTTPRGAIGKLISPAFIDFNLSVDGFGYLFLPSVFPQPIQIPNQTGPPIIGGVGSGERVFPPPNGLTFSTWICIVKHDFPVSVDRRRSMSRESSPKIEDPKFADIFTLYQSIEGAELKKKRSYSCLTIALSLKDQMLIVSTQAHSLKGARRSRFDMEEHTLSRHARDKIKEASFDCSCLFEESKWHHVAIVIHKNVIRGANASLYLNGALVDTQKVTYIQPVVNQSSLSAKDVNTLTSVSINGIIGTHTSLRHCLPICYNLGPTFLFDEPISPSSIPLIWKLGSTYMGCFQAPVMKDSMIAAVHLGSQSVLGPIVSEERVVFGVVANVEKDTSMQQLEKEVAPVDLKAIAKEMRLKRDNVADPVKFLSNIAVHLSGPSRTPGAVIVGSSGVRIFTPKPISTLLSSVGGTNVMLGLIAMATTAECLYASVKALVCTVGGNSVALKDMEKSGSFKILGMFLRSKSSLLNGNILHLILSLVGTLDSEHECIEIPYPQAFKDLLADLSVWSEASQDIQRSLLQHFRELLVAGVNESRNAKMMTEMGLVSTMLHQLQDADQEEKSKKDICDTLALLFRCCLNEQDLRRFGQYMVNTLPEKFEGGFHENRYPVYSLEPETPVVEEPVSKQQRQRSKSSLMSEEAQAIQSIRLRNLLLDLVEQLMLNVDRSNEDFLTKFHKTLGFDWLLLFFQPHIHRETVARGLRLLVHILSIRSMYNKFRDGELAGTWLEGAEEFLVDPSGGSVNITDGSTSSRFYTLMSPKSGHFQHVKNIAEMTNEMKGFQLLSYLLPHHTQTSQSFIYIVALLLGRPISEISYGTQFNSETLMKMLEMAKPTSRTSTSKKAHKSLKFEAVNVLLSFLRYLLHNGHKPGSEEEIQTLTLITFIRKLYSQSSFPEFVTYAQQPEFVESLVMTLFSPPTLKSYNSMMATDMDELGFVVVASDEALPPPALLQADKDHADIYSVIQLLVTIVLDGLGNVVAPKNLPPHCPILDMVLDAASFTNPTLQGEYQSILLNATMEHITSGAETPADLFFESKSLQKSLQGFTILCHKIVDKLWQGFYRRPSATVYTFMRTVLEQAKAQPNLYNVPELQRAMNRVILFQLSSPTTTTEDQSNIVSTLCIMSSQIKQIFDKWNTDNEFLLCLVCRLIELVASEDQGVSSSYIPTSQRNLYNAANRFWAKLLEHKKDPLQELFHIELPIVASGTLVSPTVGDMPLFGAHSPTLDRKKRSKLQNCKDLRTEQLIKTWESYLAAEKSGEVHTAQKSKTLSRKSLKRVASEVKVDRSREIVFVEEYVMVHTPALVRAVHSLERVLQKKYKRNCDYSLRFTASEWSHIVYRLTRERGLWGPDKPCFLDKWMLDSTEGPARMRKRMCRNPQFYHNYPYISQKCLMDEYEGRTKPPRSLHSVYQHCRQQLFKETSHLSMPVMQVHSQAALVDNLAIDYGIEPFGVLDEDVTPQPQVSDVDEQSVGSDEADDPVTQAVLRMLEQDEKVKLQVKCALLDGLDARDGVFLFGVSHFYVIQGVTLQENGGYIDIESMSEGSFIPVVPTELRSHMSDSNRHLPMKCIKWNYGNIREIHKRRYVLRECALEIFSDDGRNNFLIFEKEKMPTVYHKLESMTTVFQTSQTELIAGIKPSGNVEEGHSRFLWFSGEKSLAQKWENGEISNFQYLMHLNTLAGRTYNDLMQYPIFPWVIADYQSETLDLTDPKTFRDLSKPMGAQTEERKQYYMQKYSEDACEPTFNEPEHFHYRIHYCSAMTVASYLIRMEPYTQYFIHLQDGHFDRADRAFNSIEMAWKSASGEDRNDIREVIPEFYYLPDFLTNSNMFVLGAKQNGTVIGDVILPPWAKGDPREFIRVQREALESDYVSAHLHEWIDLIFGYKQSGPAAVEACNVFHPYFYEQNVRDIDKLHPADRRAALSIIHHFGQMPKQILTKPHRQKKVPSSVAPSTDSALSSPAKYFYKDVSLLEPGKEVIVKVRNEVGQIIGDKTLLATEKYKILIPPNYTKYFAWHYDDHSARLCSVEQDKILAVFEGLHQDQILCAAAVNSNVIVTAGESTVVCVWELKKESKDKGKLSMQLTKVLYGHTDPVVCLGVSKAFQIIVSGSADSTCIIWDLNKLSFIRQLCPNSGSITALTINNQTGDIVTCTKKYVHLWSINGQLIASTSISQKPYSTITCCTMTELIPYDKDNVIAVGCSDGDVRILASTYDDELKKKKEHSRKSESSEDVAVNGRDTRKEGSINSEYTLSPGEPGYHSIREERQDEMDLPSMDPPSKDLPSKDPPSKDPPSKDPPSKDPPSKDPPSKNPPPKDMPSKDQPSKDPPFEDPPTKNPPSKDSPSKDPPSKDSPSRLKTVNLDAWDAHMKRKQACSLCIQTTLKMSKVFSEKNTTPAKVTCLSISKDHKKLFVGDSLGRVVPWTIGDSS